jgi:hypothetical protein
MLSQRGNFRKKKILAKIKRKQSTIFLVKPAQPKAFDLGQKISNYLMLLYL